MKTADFGLTAREKNKYFMKKLLFFLVFAVLFGGYAMAYDFSAVCSNGDTLYYEITSSAEPYTVKVIHTEALYYQDGDSVYVTYYYNHVNPSGYLIIPESVSYDNITYSVTSIGEYAFAYCSGLTSVTIPNSVASIDGYAFQNCNGLTSVTIGNSVTSIGMCAFSGCSGLTSVTIGNSVTSIGRQAFAGCSGLISVTIPNSVTSIVDGAFLECTGLSSVYYAGNIAGWCEIEFGDNPLEYAHNLYINNELVTDLVIPESITEIKDYAFWGATCLTSVIIPNSVTSIGRMAFRDCAGLALATIGNSVTSIGEFAFVGCSGLISVTIPNSVTSIGGWAFSDCSGLESIVVDSGNSIYDSRNDCNAIIETATNTLIQGCKNTEIPNSITSIVGAFAGCVELTSIIIPNSVTYIGDGAFGDCEGLTTIIIPNSVTSIGEEAFGYCNGLTTITIPSSVTSIGEEAFVGCVGLTSVTIGNSVTNIGEWAFYDCSSLANIFVKASEPPVLGEEVFDGEEYDIIGNAHLWVPCGTVDAYSSDEQWGQFANINGSSDIYTIILESANPEIGVAQIVHALDCETGTAVIEAIAVEGYAFLAWTDGNTDNPRTVGIISDTTFTAIFAEARTVIVEVADSEMGSVVGSGVYAEGAEIQITAIPNENYRFEHWIDVENPTRDFNTDNPRTIVVSTDVTYIAVFEVVTGIEDVIAPEIALFPNPATDILNISSPETISEIEIVNVMGQVVKRIEVNSNNAVCNVEDLTSGVYVVRIRTASATLSQQRFIYRTIK